MLRLRSSNGQLRNSTPRGSIVVSMIYSSLMFGFDSIPALTVSTSEIIVNTKTWKPASIE